MVSWVGLRLRPPGSAGSLWNGVYKKACSTWSHTYRAQGEARGTTITWANGTNRMPLCPLWEETASVGGDFARTRLLELTTEVSGFSFLPLGRNKHFKYSRGVDVKPSHPLRWDLTRGRGDEAQRLIHSWHDSLVNQMETGKLTREATWENNIRSDAWSCRRSSRERNKDE